MNNLKRKLLLFVFIFTQKSMGFQRWAVTQINSLNSTLKILSDNSKSIPQLDEVTTHVPNMYVPVHDPRTNKTVKFPHLKINTPLSDNLTSGGANTALNLDGARDLKRLIENLNFLDENVPVVMVDTNDPDTIPNTMRFTFKGGQTMDVDIKVLMGSGVLKEVSKVNNYTLNFKTYSGLSIPVDLSSWFDKFMQNSTIEREIGKDIEIVSGVIRNSGGTWNFISDSEHLGTSGFLSVETKPRYARVHYKKNYGKILTLLAAPDETYVQNGVSCGASVGTTYANIFLQQDVKLGDYIFYNGTNFISYDGSYNNMSYSAGVLTVGHTQKAFGYNLSVIGRDVCNYHLRLGSVGENSIKIKFYNMDGTQYTGVPNTDMKIFVSRNSDTELNNVTSAIQGSNVWIIGIMQKN